MGNEESTISAIKTKESYGSYNPQEEHYKQLLALRGVDTKPEISDIPVWSMKVAENTIKNSSAFGLIGSSGNINSSYTAPVLAQSVPANTKPADITPKNETMNAVGATKANNQQHMDLSSALASNSGSQFSDNPEKYRQNEILLEDNGLEVRRELALG